MLLAGRNMSAIDEQSRPALAAGVRMQTDATTGEPILLFPEGVLHLNTTAQEVVARCNGKSTVEGIVSTLANEYDASVDALRGDVLECLSELRQRKLITFKG
jgi:pyrroloquinoline quinone biosynthesis protein D